MNDRYQQVLLHRLERVLITLFLLLALFVVAVYAAAPSIYTNMLTPSTTDRYPLPTTLFLVALLVFIAVLIVGVVRHWRWLFWLLLVAFSFMILEIPATILQLTGVVPGLFPVWYSLLRMGVSIITFVIAVWMIYIYRQYGVWAMGRKKKVSLE
ncbi:MAG: hypothetical protein ACJ8CB_25780 [Ktedonobacteraceae bacterium]